MLRFEITNLTHPNQMPKKYMTMYIEGYLIIDNEDKIHILLDVLDFNDLILSSIPVVCYGVEITKLDDYTISNIRRLIEERSKQNA